MWLKVSVGLEPKLMALAPVGTLDASRAHAPLWHARECYPTCALETFGLAAKSMPYRQRAFHIRVLNLFVSVYRQFADAVMRRILLRGSWKTLLILLTSAQTRLPAELKHITKRRK